MIIIRLQQSSLFKHRCFDLFLSHTDVCLVDAISKTTNYWNDKQLLLSITIINAIIKYNTMYNISLSWILIATNRPYRKVLPIFFCSIDV